MGSNIDCYCVFVLCHEYKNGKNGKQNWEIRVLFVQTLIHSGVAALLYRGGSDLSGQTELNLKDTDKEWSTICCQGHIVPECIFFFFSQNENTFVLAQT